MDHHVAAAADIAGARIGHRHREADRDRCIDGVAALLQHFDADTCCARFLRHHHAVARGDGGARGGRLRGRRGDDEEGEESEVKTTCASGRKLTVSVVPAKAGTHTPCPWIVARHRDNNSLGGYGSLLSRGRPWKCAIGLNKSAARRRRLKLVTGVVAYCTNCTTLPFLSLPCARYWPMFLSSARVRHRVDDRVGRAGVDVAAPEEVRHHHDVVRFPVEGLAADLGLALAVDHHDEGAAGLALGQQSLRPGAAAAPDS